MNIFSDKILFMKSTAMKLSSYDPWSRSKKNDDDEQDEVSARSGSRSSKRRDSGGIVGLIIEIISNLTGFGRKLGDKKGKRPRFLSVGGIAGLLLVVWGAMGIYMVDEQERGVVLRFGKYYTVLTPGLKWQPYLIDRVIVINVTQVRSFSSRGIMLTQDENIVDITVNVQYVIDSPKDFVINTRDPELSLRQATDSSLRHVVGSTVMDQVITEGRAEVALATQERIQQYVSDYLTGIGVRQVSIQRADPPEQVKAAFEDVISAREDKVRFINQATAYSNAIIPQARGEARRILEEGEGYKRDKIARAEGQAQRFDLVYDEYSKSPAITKNRLYLEAMEEVLANSNKILIDVSEGSNNLLYLPLDRLINTPESRSSAPARGSTDTGGVSEQSRSAIVKEVIDEIRKQLPRTNR